MLNRTITIDLGDRERKEAATARRFPVSVSSEAPVKRRDWETGQLFDEVLSHKPGAVDLSRAPLPVLEGHDRSKVNVGVVTGLKLDGPRLRGELVLGSSQRAQELADDISAGIITGLSVGYTITKEERDEKAKRITATRWQAFEVSIVPVPADVTVGINRSQNMDDTTSTTSTTDAAELATRAERTRVTEIQALVTRSRLGADFAGELVSQGVTLDRARELILDRLATASDASAPSSHLRSGEVVRFSAGNDYTDDFRAAAVDALLIRSGLRVEKPHAAARDVSASVYDLARVCLSRAGKSGSRMFGGEARGPELLKRAAGTGDFPAILEGALHAAVRNGYENEPSSHRAWVRVAPFSDFRSASRPILGSAPDLDHLLEHSEYKHGYYSDEGTSYAVAKYGKIVALTWEALLADNLGAFIRVQPSLGQAARRLEAGLVYDLFALNSAGGPTMGDGTALFHANHKNLVASATFDATQLGLGRTLMRKQTALGGGYLSLVPKFLIVPAEKEQAAEILLANASRKVTSEKATAEWVASLQLVVEPRLASTGVFLAADPSQIDTCELGLLEENIDGPHIETEQKFDTDESRWKVRHAAGAKFLDYRGIVKMVVT